MWVEREEVGKDRENIKINLERRGKDEEGRIEDVILASTLTITHRGTRIPSENAIHSTLTISPPHQRKEGHMFVP